MDFELVKTIDEFVKLKQEWDDLSARNGERNFYLTYDWFYCVIAFSKESPKDLRIITARTKEGLIGIFPCYIRESRLRLFSVRSLEIIGNIYSPLRGFVVERGKEDEVAEAFCKLLLEDFSGKWDILRFDSLSPNDVFIKCLRTQFRVRGIRQSEIDEFVNIVIDLSGIKNSRDFFDKLSKNLRHNIRRGVNKICRDGEFIATLNVGGRENLAALFSHYRDVYKMSWKEEEQDPIFHHELARYAMERNWLRLFVLYFRPFKAADQKHGEMSDFHVYKCETLNDNPAANGFFPIATYLVLVYRKHAYYLKTAYVQKFAEYQPGTVLLWFSVKHLVDKDKCLNIDYQKGDQEYKLKWGQVNETRYRHVAANPRSLRANIEMINERYVIPPLKTFRKRINLWLPVRFPREQEDLTSGTE